MALIDEQYIFGIKVNDCSHQITKLSISDSQSGYNYICNVALESQCNGNGRFRVSIVNLERIEGLLIGNWVLLGGRIGYLETLLKDSEDIRSKRILAEVTDDCVKIIKLFS